jgi:hypothetical protein
VGDRFIGELSSLETASGTNTDLPTPTALLPRNRSSRVSDDGLYAAFTSTEPLTGFNSTDQQSEEPDAQVFFYDATAKGGAGELICASCNPSGARPVGRLIGSTNNGQIEFWAAATLPGWAGQGNPGTLITDDGSRLFFNSFDALVPRDTDGLQDVYEWQRAADKAECLEEIGGELHVPQSNGCLSLISSGEEASDAEVIGASHDGRDVFFLTTSSLLPQDPGLLDVYDAREGGGFAQPSVEVECEGEACQPAPPPPNDPAPTSSSFRGAGNVVEGPKVKPRCPKGKRKVRRRGKVRCVPRKQRNGKAKRKANSVSQW